MDATTNLIIGHVVMLTFRILLGGTVVYLIRRSRKVEPPWSWPKAIGAFVLLGVLATAFAVIPVVGGLATLVVFLFGLRRFTGLDLLATFFVAFAMGISVYVVAALLATQLQLTSL